jgi:HK97 family phage major capsid protein
VFHSLPRSYRGNASWVVSDALVKLVRKLKDSEGQYIWQPGLTAGQPDRILNRPVLISEGATVPAATAKSIVFGDLQFYTIADRLGMTMQRLNELYAASGQIGFKWTKRNDAKVITNTAFASFTHGAAS